MQYFVTTTHYYSLVAVVQRFRAIEATRTIRIESQIVLDKKDALLGRTRELLPCGVYKAPFKCSRDDK